MVHFSNTKLFGMLIYCVAINSSFAQESIIEYKNPPICSSFESILPHNHSFGCNVRPNGLDQNGDNRYSVEIDLTAQTKQISIGGHSVITENYGTYLPPVVEARAGDTVVVNLTNSLEKPISNLGHAHDEHHCEPDDDHQTPPSSSNPTNLHYFHGGIVSPCNGNSDHPGYSDRPEYCKNVGLMGGLPDSARWGTGDNVYSCLERGQEHTFTVKIPGFEELNAAVLERVGKISHPPGLNWYHSHLHGISSNQVMGGMAGLLSVGRRDANLRANCKDLNPSECEETTAELRRNTIVKYALLRDISLKKNDGGDWAPDPDGQDFDTGRVCGVVGKDGVNFVANNEGMRKGFCQPSLEDDPSVADPGKLWLFTINGQKFPTIEVDETKTGVLLRVGNLSPNFAYWLELYDQEASDPANGEFVRKSMTILNVDGVVPAKPQSPGDGTEPISVQSYEVHDLLLMPASRVEIYIDRRDIDIQTKEKNFVLRTKYNRTGYVPALVPVVGEDAADLGGDRWPEIQLARITFKALEEEQPPVQLALNTAIAAPVVEGAALLGLAASAPRDPPPGCMRDLRDGEYRKVEFRGSSDAGWRIVTSIMENGKVVEDEHGNPLEIDEPFENYVNKEDHSIKWDGGDGPEKILHTCVRLNKNGGVKPQLWELSNPTTRLHNFHIHQMKFRLATLDELDKHGIEQPRLSSVCDGVTDCSGPDYKFYQAEAPDGSSVSNLGRAELAEGGTISSIIEWHDTIPMPPFSITQPDGNPLSTSPVYVMMSFVDDAQVGRFVYHCHILKHEDNGLMAPIQVWDPTAPER